jgi:hypothetical protein
MSIKRRLKFLEQIQQPALPKHASEAQKALAFIARWKATQPQTADPEATETSRRAGLAALGFGAGAEPEAGEILRRIIAKR